MALKIYTPILKLLDARSALPDSATHLSTSSLCALQPVDPHTTGTPLPTARLIFPGAVAGVVNSMAASAEANASPSISSRLLTSIIDTISCPRVRAMRSIA